MIVFSMHCDASKRKKHCSILSNKSRLVFECRMQTGRLCGQIVRRERDEQDLLNLANFFSVNFTTDAPSLTLFVCLVNDTRLDGSLEGPVRMWLGSLLFLVYLLCMNCQEESEKTLLGQDRKALINYLLNARHSRKPEQHPCVCVTQMFEPKCFLCIGTHSHIDSLF